MMRLTLKINDNIPIMDLSIRRLSPEEPTSLELCRYIVEDIQLFKQDKNAFICFTECPYGDAGELAHQVLKDIRRFRDSTSTSKTGNR